MANEEGFIFIKWNVIGYEYIVMQGNIEMGFLIESHDKAKQIEEIMKEMVRMKGFGKYK